MDELFSVNYNLLLLLTFHLYGFYHMLCTVICFSQLKIDYEESRGFVSLVKASWHSTVRFVKFNSWPWSIDTYISHSKILPVKPDWQAVWLELEWRYRNPFCRSWSHSSQEVRACALATLLRGGESVLLAAVRCMLAADSQLTAKRQRYHGDSSHHRSKHRILQALLLLEGAMADSPSITVKVSVLLNKNDKHYK